LGHPQPSPGVTAHLGLGLISAAAVFGEPELAQEVMAEFRTAWEDQLREDPRELAFEIYDKVCRDLERLENAMRAQTLH
jgi:hypothetical protein